MIKNYLNIAKKNVKQRKVRSFLTILGVIVGVASIIALISISNGLENAIVEQFEKIGSNRIFISAKGSGAPGMTAGLNNEDVEILERMREFEYVTPYLYEMGAKVEYANREKIATITSWPTDNAEKRWEDYDVTIKDGRLFKEGEKNVAVIGFLAAKDLFSKKIQTGTKIEINEKGFEVIGILDEVGNSQDDNSIMIPIETARDLFNKPTEVNIIDAEIKKGLDVDNVVERTKANLGRKRDEETFDIRTPADVLKSLSNILSIVQIVLVAIAAISLVVGSIGIMNSMYTNVLERTKEIGVLKSVGASEKDILNLFLIEAGLIGLIGGIFGVILGMGISYLVENIAAGAGFKLLKIKIDFLLILFGLLFAFGIGLFSGYLPAKQASKLEIVEALRYD